MKILLTGANGFIGKRLLAELLELDHEIVATVRDKGRISFHEQYSSRVTVLEMDLLDIAEGFQLPTDIDVAYYLVHSMTSGTRDFDSLEETAARNFVTLVNQTSCKQIIYLGGIANEATLSKHLSSRKNVELVLSEATAALTTLRAGIIVGSGSASFEIICDLVEKLPVMITPKWLNTRCQPIGIRNVLGYLVGVIAQPDTYDRTFDIGGPDVLTYKEMLLGYARVKGLRRRIYVVPVMTPRLSSYWLYFVTAISYPLAVNLVNSMKVDVVCADNDIQSIVPLDLMSYDEAIRTALQRIAESKVMSSWKDSFVSGLADYSIESRIQVPSDNTLLDQRELEITHDPEKVLDNIWRIGGRRGWYYGNWLWAMRGFMDKLVGGVGLRRGRTDPVSLSNGDALDFWRVIDADKTAKRLLLYAEMKLPGDAWLEFRIDDSREAPYLVQTATFKPSGWFGKLYWYSVAPFHDFVFGGMIRNIERYSKAD